MPVISSIRRRVLASGIAAALALVPVLGSAPAQAASDPAPGADFSWPACKTGPKHLPLPPASKHFSFAIVGINDGEPGNRSACFDKTLSYAKRATGGTTQAKLAYYVMAAWPWSKFELPGVPHPAWPKSKTYKGVKVKVPAAYGASCTGGHMDPTCAYVFGWIAAYKDAHLKGLPSPSTHKFWIDVEGARDWSSSKLVNQAIVEGMHAYFTTSTAKGGLGGKAGLYSSRVIWKGIIGSSLRKGSPLVGVDNWVTLGRSSYNSAKNAYRYGSYYNFTPKSKVKVVQYWDSSLVDWDYAPR